MHIKTISLLTHQINKIRKILISTPDNGINKHILITMF